MNMKHISSLIVTVSLIISMVLLLSSRQRTYTASGDGEGWHSSIMQIARMLALSSLEQRANILEYSHQFMNLNNPECVHLCHLVDDISGGQICVKPLAEDAQISQTVRATGCWEPENVRSVLAALKKFPTATFLDLGSNIGMFTIAAALMGRSVVAVDANLYNLAYLRSSLKLNSNLDQVKLVHNAMSNDYATYYSWLPDKSNPGMLRMLTKEQLEQKNISSELPPLHAIMVKDIFQIITSDIVIAKIDIEGYECKALQSEVIQNKLGKFMPIIFMEWVNLPNNPEACPEFREWVTNFYQAGYIPKNTQDTTLNIDESSRDGMQDIAWVHHSVLYDSIH